MIDNIRNPAIMKAKMIQKLFMGLFIGSLFYGLEVDQDGLAGYKGALFYYISELTYSTIFGIQAFMPADFPPLVREYDDRIYPISAYYIAKIFSFLPIFTIDGAILIVSSYFFVGFSNDFATFFRQMLTCMIIEWNVAALGIAVCAMAPSYAIAVTVTGPLLTVFSLTGGLFTNVSEMHGWISWVQYFSWFRYGYESLIVNQFGNEKFDSISCSMFQPNGKKEMMPMELCEESGAAVVQNFSFDSSNFYTNWISMLLLTIVIYIVGYMELVRRVIANR
uniref:ABC2_membrane domain-containing protein n=1 Tax=Caenorhabditis japonica TaxID=281687 RepID=A0A8R1E1X4_CAEJA